MVVYGRVPDLIIITKMSVNHTVIFKISFWIYKVLQDLVEDTLHIIARNLL